ncbi:hypothetical protein D3C84_875010 [compost metagenome]
MLRLVQNVQNHADQEGLRCFLPVGFKTLAVRIDNQGCQVLNVANLVLGFKANFIKRVPVCATCQARRLKANNLVASMFLSPAGRHGP